MLQLWKRSGAWFFKGIPKYIVPSKKADSSAHSASSAASTRQNDRSTHVRTESKRIGQMKVAASKYNTWSHRQHLRGEPPASTSEVSHRQNLRGEPPPAPQR